MTRFDRSDDVDYVAQPWRRKSPNRDAMRLRQVEAIRLRLTGLTYTQIGKELGIDATMACHDVRNMVAAEASEKVEEYRRVEDLRLKEVLRKANEVLAEAGNTELALKALDRVLRASKSLRELWGMDLPVKVDVTMHEVDQRDLELQEMLLEAQAANATIEQQIIEAGGGDRPAVN